MPSPPRKCLVASTRSAHQTADCSRSRAGSLFPRTPRSPSPSPSHTCLTSHQATAAVCTLFQWPSTTRCTLILAAIDCGPALFPASFLSLLVSPLSHVKSMADLSLPARLLAGVEQLVWSTYMVAREFPFTILPLILIAFASLALLAVSLTPPTVSPSCLPAPATQKIRGTLPSCQPVAHWAQPASPEHCPDLTACHVYLGSRGTTFGSGCSRSNSVLM